MYRKRFFLFAMAPVCLIGPASLQGTQGLFEVTGRSTMELSGFSAPVELSGFSAPVATDLELVERVEGCRAAAPGMFGAVACLAQEMASF